MPFEEPKLVELNLDAEIGSYQADFGDEPSAPLVEPEPEPESC